MVTLKSDASYISTRKGRCLLYMHHSSGMLAAGDWARTKDYRFIYGTNVRVTIN